jgi:cysteine-rich repeat protein
MKAAGALAVLVLGTACGSQPAHTESTPVVAEAAPPVCGNGAQETGEQCDDANDVEWDGCRECQIVEFQVNSITGGDQERPDVAVADDGSFVVVWRQETEKEHHYVVMVRLFDAQGLARGEELPVTDDVEGSHRSYAIDMDVGGRFVVVWSDDTEKEKAVKARMFNKEGQPLAPSIEVYRYVQERGTSNPEVVLNQDGGFLVSWGLPVLDKGSNKLHFALLDASGTLKKHTTLLDQGCSWGSYPRLASLDWGYAFVYMCMMPMKALATPHYPTRLGFLTTALEPAADTHDVGHVIKGQHLALLPDGRYLIGAGFDAGIYDPDGTMVDDPLIFVEDTDIHPGSPGHVATDASGRIVSVWSARSEKSPHVENVKMRIMESDGTAVTSEIQVNMSTRGEDDRYFPRVDMAPDGRFVVVWEAEDQDGDGYGIYAQRFTRDGEPMGVMAW